MADQAVRILIVEDNRGDVLLVREALSEAALNFDLTHLADGEQAFDYLQRRGEYANAPAPQLVLLDLNLPKRDGWEVLDLIRSTPEFAATPVVIFSSSGNPDDRGRATGIKGCLYIRKPSSLDEFLAVGKVIARFWFEQASAEVPGS